MSFTMHLMLHAVMAFVHFTRISRHDESGSRGLSSNDGSFEILMALQKGGDDHYTLPKGFIQYIPFFLTNKIDNARRLPRKKQAK